MKRVAGAVILSLSVMLNANPSIDKTVDVRGERLVRMIDTKEEYGRSCEAYSYIPPLQRLNLLHHKDFMLGDILTDALSIDTVAAEYLKETNLTECSSEDSMLSEYTYAEALGYLNERVVTVDVFQYTYGAGAAHGNGHMFHYIYERDYGMRLGWEDLFGNNKAFELYVLKRVLKEIADEDFIAYFKLSKQLLNFKTPGYFTLTEEGLLIQYGKYEITPGSSGLPSIVIPKKVLRQYMSQENYQKYFMIRTERIAEMLNSF
jgi:hypothetical protein